MVKNHWIGTFFSLYVCILHYSSIEIRYRNCKHLKSLTAWTNVLVVWSILFLFFTPLKFIDVYFFLLLSISLTLVENYKQWTDRSGFFWVLLPNDGIKYLMLVNHEFNFIFVRSIWFMMLLKFNWFNIKLEWRVVKMIRVLVIKSSRHI